MIWDFGDGTVLGFSYDDPGFTQPQVHTWQDTGRYTVRAIFKYEDEGCITRKSDTLTAPLWFHNHYDSLIAVRLCEGNYSFREHEMERSGTYYYTTYWTESGCDTLWQIDLVTCPHCHWEYDTVALEDLPVVFNGITFGAEYHDEPIHLHIADSCDSIIYYNLYIFWEGDHCDSSLTFYNVVTPNGDGINDRFVIGGLVEQQCYPYNSLIIVDRTGRMVYRAKNIYREDQFWDPAATRSPAGTYFYRFVGRGINHATQHNGCIEVLK